jgi:drug/metabolite transporter (DMT)-like permease
MSKYFLILPLIWSFGFAIGSVTLKRALDAGIEPLRVAFLNNIAVGLMFLPGWFFLPETMTPAMLVWPLAGAAVYFAGQICTFTAMRLGDVTVVAPVLGVKVVFVAVFSVMLGAGALTWQWWAAAGISAVAVFLLGVSNWPDRRRLARTAVLAMAAAGAYAWCDVVTQIHAPALGALAFSTVMMGAVAVSSVTLIPFFREPWRTTPKTARPWAIWGSVISGAQSAGMAYTIGYFGYAARVNVVYSTRGLWSILLVWFAGSWFGNQERAEGAGVMERRLAGALLLLVAVGLVLKG